MSGAHTSTPQAPAHRERMIHLRLMLLALGVSLWALIIAVRLFHLQVLERSFFERQSARQSERTINLDPRRGPILDRNRRPLAVSVDAESIYAVPQDIDDPARTSTALSRTLGLPANERKDLLAQLQKNRAFVWVKRKVDPGTARAVRELQLDGIGFLGETRRYYPQRELMSHVLGYVGLDNTGMSGIEYAFEDMIQGRAAKVVVQTDARRRPVGQTKRPSTDGHAVVLTLDESIQHVAERELERAVTETQSVAGVVVVVDPGTGEVLALANRPSFNPNRFAASPSARWRNRAVSDAYEPGSIFKIVTAAAGLQERAVETEEVLDCGQGGIEIAGVRINDHVDFELDDDQLHLQDTARAIVAKECSPSSSARSSTTVPTPRPGGTRWSSLDWPALAIDEEPAGSGMTWVELAIVLEELGRAIDPSPFARHDDAVRAGRAPRAATASSRRVWLGAVAAGADHRHARRRGHARRPGRDLAPPPGARPTADGGSTVRSATWSTAIVPTRSPSPPPPTTATCGVRRAPSARRAAPRRRRGRRRSICPCTSSTSTLDGVVVADDRRLAGRRRRRRPRRGRSRRRRSAWPSRRSAHASGSSISRSTTSRSATSSASRSGRSRPSSTRPPTCTSPSSGRGRWPCSPPSTIAEHDDRRPLAVSMAKAAAGECQRLVVQHGIQLFGAMGYTWENDLQFALRRAKFGGARVRQRRATIAVAIAQEVLAG